MPEASTLATTEFETRTFRADAEGITAVDDWVDEIGGRWRIDERANFRARVCIAEIAGNVMEHGTESATAEFTVILRRRGTDLDVELVDSGRPFDPTDAVDQSSPESLEFARIGGLGLNLVRSLASKITYRHDGIHNRLRFHISNIAA